MPISSQPFTIKELPVTKVRGLNKKYIFQLRDLVLRKAISSRACFEKLDPN